MQGLGLLARGVGFSMIVALSMAPVSAQGKKDRARIAIAEAQAKIDAANKVGAVCMPVNWRLAPPEIEYIVRNGQAKLMMADKAFVSAAEQWGETPSGSDAEAAAAVDIGDLRFVQHAIGYLDEPGADGGRVLTRAAR